MTKKQRENEWLLRHVLDPTHRECVFTPNYAKAIRARLLGRLRDRTRRSREPVLTVRVPEETALCLDEIGRRFFESSSRSETVKAMARIATTHLRPPADEQRDLAGRGAEPALYDRQGSGN